MIMATGALIAGGRNSRAPQPEPQAIPVHATNPPTAVNASTVEAPAAVPSPLQVKERIEARQRAGATTARPATSTTDNSVTALDDAPPRPAVAPGQLARARHVAEAHQKANGSAITPGELAVRMRVDSTRANQLLAALATS